MVNIEKLSTGYIIAICQPFHYKMYFYGMRNKKPRFTLDYSQARTYKNFRTAQLKSYEISSDY